MGCDIGRIIPRWLLSTFNFLILIFTFLFLLISVFLICVPGYMMDLINYIISRPQLEISLVTQDSISHNLGANILCQLGWIFLTVALVLLVPAFLGYVGSVRESRICLIMYFVPIIVIWSAQLTFLIVLPVVKTQLYNLIGNLSKLSLEQYTGAGTDTDKDDHKENIITFLWNMVMVHLQCCGVTSYQDFQLSSVWNSDKEKLQIIPSACCMLETTNYPISRIYPVDHHCSSVPTKYNSYWTQGCLPKAASIASDYTSLIILAIISILTLEIVVIILGCCLCMLQKYRSEKICHTVIVKKEPSSSSWSRGCHPDDKNNWHQSRVQDEHKNLIYNDMRNDIIVP